MGLLDNLKDDMFSNLKEQAAQAAEDAVSKVTDAIPGELDDKLAADVVQSVEEQLGIDAGADEAAAK